MSKAQKSRSSKIKDTQPASLAHYEDAELYEATFRTRKKDVAFFVSLAHKQAALGLEGPIIEFGAGTGRVTRELVRAGFSVLAVDPSPEMRRRLLENQRKWPRAQRERLVVVDGDLRNFECDFRSDLILATFNVVAHLKEFREFAQFLQTAKNYLSQRGSLAFDVPIPQPTEIEVDPDEGFVAPRFKHPVSRSWIRHTERFRYDLNTQVLEVDNEYRAEGTRDSLHIPLNLRQWFPREVESLLYYEGFKNYKTFADYEDKPGLLAWDTLIYSAKT